MGWGAELWDVHPHLPKQLENNVNIIDQFMKFTRARIKVEKDYATSLKKVVTDFQPKQTNNTTSYTYMKAVEQFCEELTGVANQHEVVAEKLENDIVKTATPYLRQFSEDLSSVKRAMLQVEKKFNKDEKSFDSAKQKYRNAHEDVLRARDAKERGESNPELSRSEVEKLKHSHENKRSSFQSAKQEYASVMVSVDKVRQQFYYTDLPAVLSKFEQLEKQRIEKTAELIRISAEAEKSVMNILAICQQDMMKAAESVSSERDLEILANSLKTGKKPPHEEFLELDADDRSAVPFPAGRRGSLPGKPISRATKKTSKKKLKLSQQITEKEADLEKEKSAHNALVTMLKTYESNSSYGDPQAVKIQLGESRKKLDSLNQELVNLKAQLGLTDLGPPPTVAPAGRRPHPPTSLEAPATVTNMRPSPSPVGPQVPASPSTMRPPPSPVGPQVPVSPSTTRPPPPPIGPQVPASPSTMRPPPPPVGSQVPASPSNRRPPPPSPTNEELPLSQTNRRPPPPSPTNEEPPLSQTNSRPPPPSPTNEEPPLSKTNDEPPLSQTNEEPPLSQTNRRPPPPSPTNEEPPLFQTNRRPPAPSPTNEEPPASFPTNANANEGARSATPPHPDRAESLPQSDQQNGSKMDDSSGGEFENPHPKPDLTVNDDRVFCKANYEFDGSTEDSLSMEIGEWFYVADYDSGTGWTEVARYSDPSQVGIVPTSYVELHGAVQQQWFV